MTDPTTIRYANQAERVLLLPGFDDLVEFIKRRMIAEIANTARQNVAQREEIYFNTKAIDAFTAELRALKNLKDQAENHLD